LALNGFMGVGRIRVSGQEQEQWVFYLNIQGKFESLIESEILQELLRKHL
jgi:hypothetical protein